MTRKHYKASRGGFLQEILLAALSSVSKKGKPVGYTQSRSGAHQIELWEVGIDDDRHGYYYIIDSQGYTSFELEDYDMDCENAKRIENCINGCRDVTRPEMVRLLVERAFAMSKDPFNPVTLKKLHKALEAIGYSTYEEWASQKVDTPSPTAYGKKDESTIF